jgi:hypothetical protein
MQFPLTWGRLVGLSGNRRMTGCSLCRGATADYYSGPWGPNHDGAK